MPVTMKDIAGDLGVSIVTVSKVLRNHSDIGQATRKRVLKRVKELNYQPNWVARSLVTKRTHMVGLVVPDLGSQFFAEIAKGLGRKIQAKGFHLITSSSEEDGRRGGDLPTDRGKQGSLPACRPTVREPQGAVRGRR